MELQNFKASAVSSCDACLQNFDFAEKIQKQVFWKLEAFDVFILSSREKIAYRKIGKIGFEKL